MKFLSRHEYFHDFSHQDLSVLFILVNRMYILLFPQSENVHNMQIFMIFVSTVFLYFCDFCESTTFLSTVLFPYREFCGSTRFSMHIHTVNDILGYACVIATIADYGRRQQWEERRLQNIPTLCATVTLAPIGVYTMISSCLDPHDHFITNQDPWYAQQCVKLYLAYVGVDMMNAVRYSPQTFPILGGWIHHLSTGWYASWCFSRGESIEFSSTLIAEMSTILLTAPRVFPDNLILKYIRRHIFPTVFMITRVLGLGIVVVQAYRVEYLTTYFHWVLYVLFTAVNLYWWSKMIKKKKKNM